MSQAMISAISSEAAMVNLPSLAPGCRLLGGRHDGNNEFSGAGCSREVPQDDVP